jgi:hypothetical protein
VSLLLVESGDWITVYYTSDGPYVQGPFATNEEALQSVLDHYESEYALSPEEARERYASSGTEWVTRLHGKDEL